MSTYLFIYMSLKLPPSIYLFISLFVYLSNHSSIHHPSTCLFIAGEFFPHNVVDKLRDEQYVQESGIGDLDLVLGFNNQEGGLVTMGMALYNMTLETVQSPGFFKNILNSCLIYAGVNRNEAVKKVMFQL